ncbi:O-acyltransferase like protein isoform X2 [Plectropomus leopardus]|uniref:O-acyltransferase like protein isoform X2 n=1 Tax=Plectropomus leopardus TaxID=160734 RepID=UPI001C4D5A62|nr:O-acyltransferase like protein isoform X2 [Plectropomus leopardus]
MALRWVAFLLFGGYSAAFVSTKTWTVSQRCAEDTNTFLWEIKQDRPQEYAVLMYDAFGKVGSNVKGGNANQPGLLQQCRSAHGPAFSGQYCQVFLRQGAVQYFVGVCVPDTCGEEDVQMLALYGKLEFRKTSLIPPLPSILVNQSTQEMIMTHCLPNTISPSASDVTCLFVCCVMVAIPLAATLFTAIIRWQRNKEVSPISASSCLNTGLNVYGALKTNGPSSSDINSSTSEENSSHSTRRTSLCFARSCVHRCLQAFSIQTTSQGVLSTSSSIPGGGYSSLNGIRVLSLLWIMCGHSAQFPVINNLDNYKNWKTTVERSPLHVLSISGPVFLAVDTFLLLGHRGVFVVVAGGLLLMTTVLSAVITALLQLPVFQPSTLTSENYVLYYYVKPHTRYGPFLIGILTGIYLTTKKEKLLKQKWQAALGWFSCLSLMAAVVGLAFILRETPAHPSVPHALYQGLHRPLWALAVTWIILACEEGYGGFIKSLLSLGFWVPLSNISFACYLTHPVFIILYIGLQETPIHYTDINFMYLFLGHLVLTLVVGYVFTLLIEKPYLLLKGSST